MWFREISLSRDGKDSAALINGRVRVELSHDKTTTSQYRVATSDDFSLGHKRLKELQRFDLSQIGVEMHDEEAQTHIEKVMAVIMYEFHARQIPIGYTNAVS